MNSVSISTVDNMDGTYGILFEILGVSAFYLTPDQANEVSDALAVAVERAFELDNQRPQWEVNLE